MQLRSQRPSEPKEAALPAQSRAPDLRWLRSRSSRACRWFLRPPHPGTALARGGLERRKPPSPRLLERRALHQRRLRPSPPRRDRAGRLRSRSRRRGRIRSRVGAEAARRGAPPKSTACDTGYAESADDEKQSGRLRAHSARERTPIACRPVTIARSSARIAGEARIGYEACLGDEARVGGEPRVAKMAPFRGRLLVDGDRSRSAKGFVDDGSKGWDMDELVPHTGIHAALPIEQGVDSDSRESLRVEQRTPAVGNAAGRAVEHQGSRWDRGDPVDRVRADCADR